MDPSAEFLLANPSIRGIISKCPQAIQKIAFMLPSFYTTNAFSSALDGVKIPTKALQKLQQDVTQSLSEIIQNLNGASQTSVSSKLVKVLNMGVQNADAQAYDAIVALPEDLAHVAFKLVSLGNNLSKSLSTVPALPPNLGKVIIDSAVPTTTVDSLNRDTVTLYLPTPRGPVAITPIIAVYGTDLYLYLTIPEYQNITAPFSIMLAFIHPVNTQKVLKHTMAYDPSLPQFQSNVSFFKIDQQVWEEYISWPHFQSSISRETGMYIGAMLLSIGDTASSLVSILDSLPKSTSVHAVTPAGQVRGLPLPIPLASQPHITPHTTRPQHTVTAVSRDSMVSTSDVKNDDVCDDKHVVEKQMAVRAIDEDYTPVKNVWNKKQLPTTVIAAVEPISTPALTTKSKKSKKNKVDVLATGVEGDINANADADMEGDAISRNYIDSWGDKHVFPEDTTEYVEDSEVLFELRRYIEEYNDGNISLAELHHFIDQLDPNTRDQYHHSCLITAAYARCATALKRLIDNKANVNSCDIYGSNALVKAVLNNDLDSVRYLLQVPNINLAHFVGKSNSKSLRTALFTSLLGYAKNTAVSLALLKAGAPIDDVHGSEDGRSSAFLIVSQGHGEGEVLLKCMLQNHRNPENPYKQDIPYHLLDKHGNNIIMHAAKYFFPAKYWKSFLEKATAEQRLYVNSKKNSTNYGFSPLTHLIVQYNALVESPKRFFDTPQRKSNILEVAKIMFSFGIVPSEKDVEIASRVQPTTKLAELVTQKYAVKV